MSENRDDSLKLDLEAAAVEIRKLGADRDSHNVFANAIIALDARCRHGEHITADYVLRVLGEPDTLRYAGKVEIWEYEKLFMHGPDVYTGIQSFVMVDGVCQGLPRESFSEWFERATFRND